MLSPSHSLPSRGAQVQGFTVRRLADCDPAVVAADLQCPSLRERMSYHHPTLLGHVRVLHERALAGTDVVFALSDATDFFGVCGLLAYRDGVEGAIYLHDRYQGRGLLGPCAQIVGHAAMRLGHRHVWVSIAADNARSLQAFSRKLAPDGTEMTATQEGSQLRPAAPREARITRVSVAAVLAGGTPLTEPEVAAVGELAMSRTPDIAGA